MKIFKLICPLTLVFLNNVLSYPLENSDSNTIDVVPVEEFVDENNLPIRLSNEDELSVSPSDYTESLFDVNSVLVESAALNALHQSNINSNEFDTFSFITPFSNELSDESEEEEFDINQYGRGRRGRRGRDDDDDNDDESYRRRRGGRRGRRGRRGRGGRRGRREGEGR